MENLVFKRVYYKGSKYEYLAVHHVSVSKIVILRRPIFLEKDEIIGKAKVSIYGRISSHSNPFFGEFDKTQIFYKKNRDDAKMQKIAIRLLKFGIQYDEVKENNQRPSLSNLDLKFEDAEIQFPQLRDFVDIDEISTKPLLN